MEVSLAIFWLVLAVIMAVIELATMGLVTIWFTIGAVFALLLSLLGTPLWAQILVFVIVSALVLVLARPIATKYVNNRTVKTNIDALIGRKLVAKEDIDNLKGTGKVDMDGTTWRAVSTVDNIVIRKDELVRIVKVSGAKVIVEREGMSL
ncbi:NfeD family protein [Butyrivibrio proteoclasticus]|uniref:NfeD family protein n=1 Tax=Butyrivibrio proteoclasticus TaxID=43305 RepID=UPI00047DB31A|nr:NfeD family protein [Butyrivibrio proteoclasticus]